MNWFTILGWALVLLVAAPAYIYLISKLIGAGLVSGVLSSLKFHKEKTRGCQSEEQIPR
jgi:hypothetical protein